MGSNSRRSRKRARTRTERRDPDLTPLPAPMPGLTTAPQEGDSSASGPRQRPEPPKPKAKGAHAALVQAPPVEAKGAAPAQPAEPAAEPAKAGAELQVAQQASVAVHEQAAQSAASPAREEETYEEAPPEDEVLEITHEEPPPEEHQAAQAAAAAPAEGDAAQAAAAQEASAETPEAPPADAAKDHADRPDSAVVSSAEYLVAAGAFRAPPPPPAPVDASQKIILTGVAATALAEAARPAPSAITPVMNHSGRPAQTARGPGRTGMQRPPAPSTETRRTVTPAEGPSIPVVLIGICAMAVVLAFGWIYGPTKHQPQQERPPVTRTPQGPKTTLTPPLAPQPAPEPQQPVQQQPVQQQAPKPEIPPAPPPPAPEAPGQQLATVGPNATTGPASPAPAPPAKAPVLPAFRPERPTPPPPQPAAARPPARPHVAEARKPLGPPEPPVSLGPVPELTRDIQSRVMRATEKAFPGCIREGWDTDISIGVIVAPSGEVSSAEVQGPLGSTPSGRCLAQRLIQARFPPITSGKPKLFYWSYHIPEAGAKQPR